MIQEEVLTHTHRVKIKQIRPNYDSQWVWEILRKI